VVGVLSVRRWLLIGLAVASSACETTPEEKALQACSVLCTCMEAPLPAVQDRCVAKCTDELDVGDISDQCIACVTANSDKCSTLENVCASICNPPPQEDFPDAGIGI
jgi:hypothetical protein